MTVTTRRRRGMASSSKSLGCYGLLLLGMATTLLQPVHAISLLNGRFETTSDVQSILNFALDATDMREATSIEEKKNIFEVGRNAGISIASLSTNAVVSQANNPIYHFFRHAFSVIGSYTEGEPEGEFDGASVDVYAKTIVEDLFDLNVTDIETEAALVMIVWMSTVTELFNAMVYCKSNDSALALQSLDKAVAYWVGEGQVDGSNEAGSLLYNLAEVAGERFGQDNGETAVNTELMTIFTSFQTNFQAGNCAIETEMAGMRTSLKRAVGVMTIPLVQMMIHHIMNVDNEGGSEHVELYALALIPRVAVCDPRAYQAQLDLDVFRNMSTEHQADAIQALQASYSCLQISCDDVGTYQSGTVPACSDDIHTTTLAGYSTDRPEVREKSFIDRDVMQIDILLKYIVFGPALDWYQYGWNSVYSLQELARNEVMTVVTGGLLDTVDEYWESTTVAHDTIINAFEFQDQYADASYPQLRATITGLLSNFVLYLSSVNAMQFAVQECLQSRQSSAMEAWDAAAAFYVGSMVGEIVTDVAHGVLLFSTARDLCDDFSTCLSAIGNADAMDSASNINIMAGFRAGILSIGLNTCQDVADIVENSIVPQMAVPLFQGVVKYALNNVNLDIGTTDASLATGDTFASALLPTLDSVNPESAELVFWNMLFQLNDTIVTDGFDAVTDALRQCLVDLPTQCFDVGILEKEPVASNLCNGVPTAPAAPVAIVLPTLAPVMAPSTPAPVVIPVDPPQAAPTRPPYPAPVEINPEDIAWGRYVFTSPTVADGDANFALDIRDMFEAAGNTAALAIYQTGANAVTTGLSGVVGTVSLQSLNTEAAQYMSTDPMFNIYKYALYSDDNLDDTDGGDFLFADQVVLEAMSSGRDHKLAAEAAVVLNVFMVIAHKLYQAVETCRTSGNPDTLIDSAVALWIGKEQADSAFDTGWMIYSIAQSDHKFYGHPDGESPINTKLMELFNDAQSLSRQCSTAPNTFIALRENVNEAIRYLTLPIIKALLFHMVKSTKNMVELYSVAVIPQSAACNPKTNEDLEALLFAGYHRSKINDQVKDTLVDFLRCQRVTCADIEVTSEADEELAEFVNSLCSRLEPDNKNLPMAGYQPTSDVTEYARLDQDTMLIQIFMITEAYGAARDVYEYGFSSKMPVASASGSNFLSWRNLAIAANRAIVPTFELYSNYFNSQTYADDIIMEGLTQTGTYAGASRWQLEETVVRALQTMVGYMSTLTYMQSALDKCKNKDPDGAVLDWDVAIAIMVGSLEGQTPAEQTYGNGRQMYGLGNEWCPEFNTCEGSGESRSNEILMLHVAEARNALMDKQCDQLERTLSSTRSNLDVALLQGVLYYAEQNVILGTGTIDEDLSTANIISLALEPLVKASNATTAQILASNFGFDLTATPVTDGTAVVYKALANSVRAMGIDCADIGMSKYSETYSVCDTQVAAPIQDTPTNLGNDLYVTTTYVQDRANIAKDISDMMEALTNGEPDLAELIYKQGKNSEVYDENGKFKSLRSLAGFSKDETAFMLDDPVFNLFLFGNKSSRRRLQTAESRTYADDYVMSTFSNSNGEAKTVPAEAALALNLWMYVNHLLYDTLRHCGERNIKNDDGVHSIDEAVAYWIGDVGDSGAPGSLLYGLAEEMGEIFKLNDAGQSRTNANMMRLFNEAKNELSLPNACTDSPTTVIRLRSIVDKISAQMTIPLIQGLIHNLRTNDRDRVSLYAHAYVPLVAGCSPNAFEFLRDKLLKSEFKVIDGETIVSHVRDSLFCLGLQCDDIGTHPSEVLDGNAASECKDPDRLHTLAGYKPAHDVREFARFDLDLLELDIFMQMRALKPAQDIYTYGKHVRNQNDNDGSLSLYHLATTSDRSNVDQFETFTRYYQANDYANKMIQGALSSADNAMSDERRRVMVVRSSQVLVMYFGALQAVNEAVTACSNDGENRYDAAGGAWDKAAAMLIGSLEGAEYGGSRHGYMFYDLAQEYCLEFGTCGEDLDTDVNTDFTRLLYAGRGAVLANSCRALQKAADELSTLVLVPVIQGLLSSSIQISSSTGNPDVAMAEGYIFSRAVLPLVDGVNRDAANTISNNLGSTGPQVTSSVASEVFSSMSKVYNGMKIDCNDIGKPQGFDPCSGVGKIKKQKSGVAVKVIGVLVGLCVLCMCALCVRSRRRGAKSLPENNPKFVAPEGELNHSMDLLQKAFSSNGRPTSETDKLTGESYDASPAIGDHDDDGEAAPLRESASDII